MTRLRNPGCLATASFVAVFGLYFSLVASTASTLLQAEDAFSKALGVFAILFPAIGVVWIARGWRLGSTVKKMAGVLDGEGRLPIHDGDTLDDGRLTEDAAEAVFEVTRRAVEARPDDWRAWFHVAYAYEASANRPMARRALRHAARLFRAENR